MSDSESDYLPGNVFTFQNENTTVCAKGPNLNSANFTNLSFRNNFMTSTMHMSRNFGRHRYGEPSFDQRSMCYRRETSPMSLYSGSDMRRRNQSYYHGGMSSQRSMYNGRSGSPMSMRSMDSNASVSAVDIALAFKNVDFNKYDLRMIKEAYNKLMKRRQRKKIEKRRNMGMLLKEYRHNSGDFSDQGSESSNSSDECKSTTSAMYKDNMSSCRSTRTDLTDFRKITRDCNMYKDCTENFKQNSIKNMLQVPPANMRYRSYTPCSLPASTVQSHQGFTQKDRFKKGFLLPSQRFNRSVASVPIPERDRLQKIQNTLQPENHSNNVYRNTQERVNNETDSDQEEIFSQITIREKSKQNNENNNNQITHQGKRSLEFEETSCSNRKRTKLSSPVKQNKSNCLIKDAKAVKVSKKRNAKNIKDSNGSSSDNKIEPNIKNNNDFEFIKPQIPVRKSGPVKTKEKLISLSAPPLIDTIIPQIIIHSETKTMSATKASVSKEKQTTPDEQQDAAQNSTSDISMRPSFIKRKLFSQKMDVTERKNISNDAINVNSPQTNVYSAIQNEKHKARKLVTNQSCLSRDVVKEDNNFLDLIHKIVPPDRMNVTNVTNKTSISTTLSNKTNLVDIDDKWDVTSVISTCNNDDVSDTYTDEEIFAMDEKKKTSNGKVVKNNDNGKILNKINNCKILVEKLPQNVIVSTNPVVEVNNAIVSHEGNGNNDYLKKKVYNCVKTFWDTDFESDVESSMPKQCTSAVKENQIAVMENHSSSINMEADKTVKNKNTLNMNLASVSVGIKSKTMPTNNMGKLKFNMSKHLSIESSLSPKHKKSKVKEQKIVIVNPQKEDCFQPSSTESDKDTKQSNKQTTTSKSKKDDSDSKNNELKNNHKLTPSPTTKNTKPTQPLNKPNNNKTKKLSKTRSSLNKTKNNNKSTQLANETKYNNETTQSENETKHNNQVTQSSNKNNNNLTQNKTKNKKTKNNNKPAQSPNQTKNKTGQSQTDNSAEKTVANRSISVRSVRTPKRKACCIEYPSPAKPVTKSTENPNKKLKLVDNITCKGKHATKNDSPPENKNNQKNSTNKNKKKLEPETDPSRLIESETSNRTLRSRRINLSSSLNSSDENLTSLNIIRSLRTRRVDLSSSLKKSSADVTTIKNSRSKAQVKKSAKPGHAALLDKRHRR